MNKQFVTWKTYVGKDIRGLDYDDSFPELLAVGYDGNFLSVILSMDKKQPISFEQAARMAEEKYDEAEADRNLGYLPGQHGWYLIHFTEWIASLGYHIELTGDEFDQYNPSLADN